MISTAIELRGTICPEITISESTQSRQSGYKETICLIDGDCFVKNNNDIEIGESIQFAIEIAKYLDKSHKLDVLCEKFKTCY